jgi:hypothetical protein
MAQSITEAEDACRPLLTEIRETEPEKLVWAPEHWTEIKGVDYVWRCYRKRENKMIAISAFRTNDETGDSRLIDRDIFTLSSQGWFEYELVQWISDTWERDKIASVK